MGSSSSSEKLSDENKIKIKSELKVLLKKKLKNKSSELSKKKSDKKKVSDFKETAKKILIKKPVTKIKKLSEESSKKIGEFKSLIKTAVVKGKKKIGSSKTSPDLKKTAKKILIKKPVTVVKKLASEGSKKLGQLESLIKTAVVKGKKKLGLSKTSPKKKVPDFKKTAEKILIKKPVTVVKKLASEGSKKIGETGSLIKSAVVKAKKTVVSKKSSKVMKGGCDCNLMR